MKSIGQRIEVLRRQRGLSKNRLAKILGVSHQAVSQWEMGKADPVSDRITKLADVLNCDAQYLLSGCTSRHDDFELLLLNALKQSGIAYPRDFKPPHSFRLLYKSGQISRRDCLALMRNEFIKLREENKWRDVNVPLPSV